MSNQGFSELALQPLAPSDYSMVMAKSRENRLTFATWLMFFRDRVNTIAFLAQDLVILLDPKDIVENIHDAYQHPLECVVAPIPMD